jgi:hypothetical protein
MSEEQAYSACQSCGMPMKRDEKGGGTNADGTMSRKYCSHCWQDGRFTLPDLTAEGMQDLVKGKMKELGFPGFMAGFFTRRIPRLERWDKS